MLKKLEAQHGWTPVTLNSANTKNKPHQFGGVCQQSEGQQICRPSYFFGSEPGARRYALDNLDVLSLPALGALGDVELNALAFLQ